MTLRFLLGCFLADALHSSHVSDLAIDILRLRDRAQRGPHLPRTSRTFDSLVKTMLVDARKTVQVKE